MSPQARRRQRPGPEGGWAGLPWASLVWSLGQSRACLGNVSQGILYTGSKAQALSQLRGQWGPGVEETREATRREP